MFTWADRAILHGVWSRFLHPVLQSTNHQSWSAISSPIAHHDSNQPVIAITILETLFRSSTNEELPAMNIREISSGITISDMQGSLSLHDPHRYGIATKGSKSQQTASNVIFWPSVKLYSIKQNGRCNWRSTARDEANERHFMSKNGTMEQVERWLRSAPSLIL